MNNLVPIAYYTPIFLHVILGFVLITVVHTTTQIANQPQSLLFNRIASIILLVFTIGYMGLRPISGQFIDMTVYDMQFNVFKGGGDVNTTKDQGFYLFMRTCAKLMQAETFFLLCTIIYVMAAHIALKKWFPNFTLIALLMYICSFSFWAYGTNGIRAGLAASLFIAGIAYSNRKMIMVTLFAISLSFHGSMILPLIAWILTYFLKDTKIYLYIWISSILLSMTMGTFWQGLLSGLETEDERVAQYMVTDIVKTGFRWDFLLYSAVGVFTGVYFIFIKKFKDNLYSQIINTYLFANAFWILVIRANFTNRFAYLSWFLLPLIICYPLLKKTFFSNQYSMIGIITLIYYSFTYILIFILGKT